MKIENVFCAKDKCKGPCELKQKNISDDIVDVGLICTKCKTFYHSFYTDENAIKTTKKLTILRKQMRLDKNIVKKYNAVLKKYGEYMKNLQIKGQEIMEKNSGNIQ